MGANRPVLDDLLSLSLQLNRQAFANPPIDGWLTSFLTVIGERFAAAGLDGAQVVQVVGNTALQAAYVGDVPAETSRQHTLDPESPVLDALRTRQLSVTPNARHYPITVGSDAIGVLIAYCAAATAAQVETLDRILGALALQLGPALLQNLRAPAPQTGRLRRQVDMMRSLYEVTRDFSSARESSEMLGRAARSLVETLHIDHVGIVVFDEEQESGSVIAEYPDSGIIGTRLPLRSLMQARLRETRAPVIISNVDTSPECAAERPIFQQLGIKSIAILPMIVQDELIGSVGLDAFYDYHEFTAEEIEVALAVTSQLAITAHNAQIYDELRRRANQLERVTELSRRVTSTFDRGQIFQVAREETLKIIDADLVSVALVSEGVLTVYLLANSGPVMAEFPVERAALRFVLNHTEPLVLDDISGSDDPDYRLFFSARMRAAATVPLIAGGRAIGVYSVLHHQPGYFGSVDLAVLEQIGNQLAIALENARLYTQTVQRAETERMMNRLSSAIQGRGDLNSVLLSTVQEMAEALSARRARVRLEMPTRQADPATRQTASRLVERLLNRQSGQSNRGEE